MKISFGEKERKIEWMDEKLHYRTDVLARVLDLAISTSRADKERDRDDSKKVK